LTGCTDDWTSGRGHLVVTSPSRRHDRLALIQSLSYNHLHTCSSELCHEFKNYYRIFDDDDDSENSVTDGAVARCAVAVEAVGAVTEILADDILTRGSRRTLVPTSSALVDVCQHHDSARHAALLHRHTTQSAVGTYALSVDCTASLIIATHSLTHSFNSSQFSRHFSIEITLKIPVAVLCTTS